MHEKNTTEMKMPSDYVDMNSDELEYDGGTDWKRVGTIIGIAVAAVGVIALTTFLIMRGGGPAAQLAPGEIPVITSGPCIVPLPPI